MACTLSNHQQSVMQPYRWFGALWLLVLSSDRLEQAYIALSDMIMWGMKDEEVDLSLLYDLLRHQFHNPDDLWVKETLQWWDRYVTRFPSGHLLFMMDFPAKFSQPPTTGTKIFMTSGTWRAHQ